MVESVFLAFLSSSCDENHPPIFWVGIAHFPEWLYIFFKCGVHSSCPYSRGGLTKVVNNFFIRGSSRYEKVLPLKPAIAFAFFTFTEMGSSNFSSASGIMGYYGQHLMGKCFIAQTFLIRLVKIESDIIVRSFETNSGRWTLVLDVISAEAYPIFSFSDLTCHLEDTGLCRLIN